METSAIVALLLAILDLAKQAPEIITHLKQNKELTPEQELALDNQIADLKKLPHWQR